MQENNEEKRPRRPGFVEVLDGEGRLLFLFDPQRDLIEIKPKGREAVLIDLRMYRPAMVGTAHGKAI
jgi:hypothetical protein